MPNLFTMKILLPEIELYVTSLFKSNLNSSYIYHNLSHTRRVVNSVKVLIEGENIAEDDTNSLLIAAWFHDIGFIKTHVNHEELSIEIAEKFLKEHQVSDEKIRMISGLIMATKMGHQPQTDLEKIIKDADCAHFADKSYQDISELLRGEWELTSQKDYNDIDWTQENIDFFTKCHQFHSTFALNNWQKGKDKNLASLLKKLKRQKQEAAKDEAKKEELALKKTRAKLPERGVETMFRVTLKNHITLSDIADTKANILLSVNAIIVSLALSSLLPKLDNPSNAYLIIPTIIFVLFTVASMILSVLATRPNVTQGQFTRQDVKDKKVNLLFFGNFHKMSLTDFEWAMGEMMKDRDYLYSSMKKDLYFLGIVLNRKYKILRTTYTVFIIGIVISVFAFAVSFRMQPEKKEETKTETTKNEVSVIRSFQNNLDSYYYS